MNLVQFENVLYHNNMTGAVMLVIREVTAFCNKPKSDYWKISNTDCDSRVIYYLFCSSLHYSRLWLFFHNSKSF